MPSQAHDPRPKLPDIVHGRHVPPVTCASAGSSGGAEPVPNDPVVM
jgi:hypothetical protein